MSEDRRQREQDMRADMARDMVHREDLRNARIIRDKINLQLEHDAALLLMTTTPGSRADIEVRLASFLHDWARREFPAGVVCDVDIEIGEPATPGTLRLVIRTEGKWGRRWRLFREWCAQQRRIW